MNSSLHCLEATVVFLNVKTTPGKHDWVHRHMLMLHPVPHLPLLALTSLDCLCISNPRPDAAALFKEEGVCGLGANEREGEIT